LGRGTSDYAAAATGFLATLRNVGVLDAIRAGGAVQVPWFVSLGLITAIAGDNPGEAQAKAVSRLELTPDSMTPHKASVIVVLSELLLRAPDFPVDAVRQEMAGALAAATDAPFVAALTSGVTPVASVGDIEQDVLAALQAVPHGAASRLIWVLGGDAHDRWSALSANGTPKTMTSVIRSDQVTSTSMLLVDASAIAIADRGIEPSAARNAALEVSDNPSGASDSPPAPVNLVSLWQTASVALRLEREVRYRRMRSDAVAVIEDIDWLTPGSP
jgi:hypothetical protein